MRPDPVFGLDRPWERIVIAYFTVIHDPDSGRYHLYYHGGPSTTRADATEEAREIACVHRLQRPLDPARRRPVRSCRHGGQQRHHGLAEERDTQLVPVLRHAAQRARE